MATQGNYILLFNGRVPVIVLDKELMKGRCDQEKKHTKKRSPKICQEQFKNFNAYICTYV